MRKIYLVNALVCAVYSLLAVWGIVTSAHVMNAVLFHVSFMFAAIIHAIVLIIILIVYALRHKERSKIISLSISLAAVFLLGIVGTLLLPQVGRDFVSAESGNNFIGETVYENVKYGFRLDYPKSSVFANANPQSGFVTRFFIPNGETIAGDTENIGIYVNESSEDLEILIKRLKESYSKNGPVEIKEVQFAGQKGYRVVFMSDYSALKGTRELFYVTVKNETEYGLNYFPVAKNITIADTVASSFEFTK